MITPSEDDPLGINQAPDADEENAPDLGPLEPATENDRIVAAMLVQAYATLVAPHGRRPHGTINLVHQVHERLLDDVIRARMNRLAPTPD